MKVWLPGTRANARSSVAIVLMFAAAPVMAADLDYTASLGAGASDNPARVPDNDVETEFATAGLRFSFDQISTRVRADIVGDLAYHEYLDDEFDSELVGNVHADTAFALVPERVVWYATEQFGQLAVDPFQPVSPENRQDLNYFSTGPDFMVGLGSQIRLKLGARYSLIDYETDPVDAAVTAAKVALVRELSGRSSISLNADLQQFDYDDDVLNSNFDQTEGFLRYQAEGARTNLTVDLGYTELDRELLAEKQKGELIRVDGSRRISGSSVLTFDLGHQFMTSAGAFASEQGNGTIGVGVTPGEQTSEPFLQDNVTLGWIFNRNLTGVSLLTTWERRKYENNPVLDQQTTTIAAGYRRELSAATSLAFSASQRLVGREAPAVDYDELTVGVAFAWRLTRNLTFDARYDLGHRGRDITFGGYTENRLLLTLGYGRGVPRSARATPSFGVDARPSSGN